MRRIAVLIAAFLSAGVTTASSAPAPAPYNWTGLYVGLNGGWAWGETRHTLAPATGFSNFDVSGGLFGGQLGYNHQWGNLLLGIEVDQQWSGIDGDASVPGATMNARVRHFGTVRARIGLAWDRHLAYFTIGKPWSSIKVDITGFGSESRSKFGCGVIGGGWEYAFNPNWSAKVEYLWVNLQARDYFLAAALTGHALGEEFSVIRAGLNFKFWPGR